MPDKLEFAAHAAVRKLAEQGYAAGVATTEAKYEALVDALLAFETRLAHVECSACGGYYNDSHIGKCPWRIVLAPIWEALRQLERKP